MARAKIALIGAGMIGGTLAHIAAREALGPTSASSPPVCRASPA